jgi:hypothetical protein
MRKIIRFESNLILAATKALAGEYGFKDPEGYFSGTKVFDVVNDLFPAGPRLLQTLIADNQDITKLIPWRGRAYYEGEYKKYLNTPATVNLIKDHLDKNKRLYPEDVYEARAEILRIEFNGKPGVYLLQNPDLLHIIYVGVTEDLGDRPHGREVGIVTDCWATTDYEGAELFEKHIHKDIQKHELLLEKYKKSKGKFVFEYGLDGRTIAKEVIAGLEFHYNTIKAPDEKPRYRYNHETNLWIPIEERMK